MEKRVPPGRVPEPLILIRAHFYTSPSGCSASGRSRHSATPRFCLRCARRVVTKCHVLSRHVTNLPYHPEATVISLKCDTITSAVYVLSTFCPFPRKNGCDIIKITEGYDAHEMLTFCSRNAHSQWNQTVIKL